MGISEKEDYFVNGANIIAEEMISQLVPFIEKHRYTLNKEQVALLVLDMQEAYIDKNSISKIPAINHVIPNIENLLNKYKDSLVIFTKHISQGNDLMSKWWKSEIKECDSSSELYFKNYPSVVVIKGQYDAFYNTNLEEILRENDIKQLIITGVMTNLCCESTARSAFMKGYEVFFVADATATRSYDLHFATLANAAHGFAQPVLTKDLL